MEEPLGPRQTPGHATAIQTALYVLAVHQHDARRLSAARRITNAARLLRALQKAI